MPDNVNVPEPALVNAPDVLAPAPEIVSVVAPLETLIVELVAAVKVKLRFVAAVLPVYRSVQPPKTELPAAVLAAPKLPDTPPSPIVATLNVPALIVVTPV